MSYSPEEDLLCPVCQDIFRDPVVLSCSHSFCRACLKTWWTGRTTPDCPCCKRKSSRSDPPGNLALRNLCEAFTRETEQRASAASEHVCSLHSEKLKIFCLDHQEPVCVVCRDSRLHSNHSFRPLNEAAQEHREEVQKMLKPLREKLVALMEAKGDGDLTVKFLKLQGQQTEKQIREQFQKLHLFLLQEEKGKVAALREEEEQKSRAMKEKVEALSREIAALSDTVRATEEELRAEDVSFLHNYKATAKRLQQRPLQDVPQPVSGALIDVVKHLGNLTFNIWSSMKHVVSYSPVVLDPNTADPELVLTSDLSSVRSGDKKQLPRNPERTRFSCSVLGSEAFTSGTHSWRVDVGDNLDWELGLLGENVQMGGNLQAGKARQGKARKGKMEKVRHHPATGLNHQAEESLKAQLWRISFSKGKLTAFSMSEPEKVLPLNRALREIGVQLDLDRGRLTFCDLSSDTHIHTFTHSFTHAVFPYIYTEDPVPVRIIPDDIL